MKNIIISTLTTLIITMLATNPMSFITTVVYSFTNISLMYVLLYFTDELITDMWTKHIRKLRNSRRNNY